MNNCTGVQRYSYSSHKCSLTKGIFCVFLKANNLHSHEARFTNHKFTKKDEVLQHALAEEIATSRLQRLGNHSTTAMIERWLELGCAGQLQVKSTTRLNMSML
jgi:hypothetical protein